MDVEAKIRFDALKSYPVPHSTSSGGLLGFSNAILTCKLWGHAQCYVAACVIQLVFVESEGVCR